MKRKRKCYYCKTVLGKKGNYCDVVCGSAWYQMKKSEEGIWRVWKNQKDKFGIVKGDEVKGLNYQVATKNNT